MDKDVTDYLYRRRKEMITESRRVSRKTALEWGDWAKKYLGVELLPYQEWYLQQPPPIGNFHYTVDVNGRIKPRSMKDFYRSWFKEEPTKINLLARIMTGETKVDLGGGYSYDLTFAVKHLLKEEESDERGEGKK
jgi:hypothetical protein